MDIKRYNDFFLLSPKEAGTDEKESNKPFNEELFEITPMPVAFNSRKCLRQRKDSVVEVMTFTELKKAG